MKLYQIHERLYTRGELLAAHADELGSDWAVVCLVSAEPTVMATLGSRYHHFPLPDGQVTERVAWRAYDAARAALEEWDVWKRHVIIHCHAGRNRAAFVAAWVYMMITKCDGDTAVKHLQAVRPNALANPHFETYLRGLK